MSCLCVTCVSVWSWVALRFALQDLKIALIAMLQVCTHCLYGTVWYTTSVCVRVRVSVCLCARVRVHDVCLSYCMCQGHQTPRFWGFECGTVIKLPGFEALSVAV